MMYALLLVICLLNVHNLSTMEVHASAYAKVPLIIGLKNAQDDSLHDVGKLIEKDLMFSGQFAITTQQFEQQLTKNTIKNLFKQAYPIALFLNYADDTHNAIEWRIYDTMQAHMIAGKKYVKRGNTTAGWAHNIADSVWPLLTGQPGFFSSKIAYCKKISNPKGGSGMKHICIADYNGDNTQVLVDTPTVNILPRWNKDPFNPLLFYSEYTNENIRMMMITLQKDRHIASTGNGITMPASFSEDGKKVVYCTSGTNGTCQLYYKDKNVSKRLSYSDPITHKNLLDGNNISPCLSHDGSIVYFCSDFLTGHPQVYAYDVSHETVESLTTGGYCACPAYCARTNKIAYIKKIQGVMQLFVYDITHKKHTQLTHDTQNKDECSWSPCGNYIIASTEYNNSSRIAIYNIPTRTYHYITAASDHCDYPTWSRVYAIQPFAS